MTVAASGAAQAQGGYQWYSSRTTSGDVTPLATSEYVRATKSAAVAMKEPSGIVTDFVGIASLQPRSW